MLRFNLFTDDAGRLRSGWRFLIFVVLWLLVSGVLAVGIYSLRVFASVEQRAAARALLVGGYGFAAQSLLLLVAAVVVGWWCARALEDFSVRSLGWALHCGWARDILLGVLVGAASLLLAAGMIFLTGGYRIAFDASASLSNIFRTLIISTIIFALGAAAEEALFRGYGLQTLLRSNKLWLAALPSSLFFALVHLDNPNVVPGWTFVNTALAGVWLAIAYSRTGSLWFPFGIHWSWNWTMASVLGIPVSGITSIAPHPLLRTTETGADWLTGGSYGVEGGVVCTLALVLSSIFILRTRHLSVADSMQPYLKPSARIQSSQTTVTTDETLYEQHRETL